MTFAVVGSGDYGLAYVHPEPAVDTKSSAPGGSPVVADQATAAIPPSLPWK